MVPQTTLEELKDAERGAFEAFKLWKEVPIQQRQVLLLTSYFFIFMFLIWEYDREHVK